LSILCKNERKARTELGKCLIIAFGLWEQVVQDTQRKHMWLNVRPHARLPRTHLLLLVTIIINPRART
jgi:hypothetical protein